MGECILKKHKHFFLTLIIFLYVFLLLIGSKDSKDVNDKLIITTFSLDKVDDEIHMYAEVANIEKGNNNESKSQPLGNKYIYYKGKGDSIVKAVEDGNRKINKTPYISAIRAIILTEDFAKDHLVEYLNRIRANELHRRKFLTMITNEDLDELFISNNERDISVGFKTEEILTSIVAEGEAFSRTTIRMLENLSSKYSGFLIPNIGLRDNDIALVGYSVINGKTVGGFIPVEDSNGLVFLKADKAKFSYNVDYNDNTFIIDVFLRKRDIKPTYKKGKIHFDLKFDFDAILMYGTEKTPYKFNNKDNKAVTKILAKRIKDQIVDVISKAQKDFKCDYLQFDDEFRVNYPQEFARMDWGKEFVKSEVNVDVKVTLTEALMMDYEIGIRKE